eukprot:jgi/Tetstr1/463979/TSEL_008784.t1
MPVRFINNSTFIRVVDTRTHVESFFNKKGLVVQAMNDPANLSFFVRSDSYTGYYNFADVETPAKPNLDALLTQLGTWAFDNLYTETFVNEPRSVLQIKVPYDKAPLYVDETRSDAVAYPRGTGTVATTLDAAVSSAHDPSSREVVMTAPVDSSLSNEGGRIMRQSKTYVACPTDKYMIAMVSGTLFDSNVIGGVDYIANHADAGIMAPSAGTHYRLGVFDDRGDTSVNTGDSGNGIYVEYHYDPSRDDYTVGGSNQNYYAVNRLSALSGGEASAYVDAYVENKLWVVLRTNVTGSVVESRVPRFDWADTLTVSDGSLFDIDPSVTQSYVFRWSAAPGMKVSVGAMHFGVVNWMHEFDILETAVYRFGNSTLPVRWELDNRRGLREAVMHQGRAIVSCDGVYDVPGRPYSFDTHLTQTGLTAQVPIPIMSLRLRSSRNRGRIHPQRLSLMNRDAGAVLKYELRLNAALTGATFAKSESFSYDNAAGTGALALSDFGSFAEVDTAATAVSGGVTLASGFFTDTAFRDVELEFREIQLVADIAGLTDTLTLVCTYIQGASTVSAGLGWLEYD